MKIIFFSDIHGNKYVLPNFKKAIDAINPDLIVFCGDVFGYYYHYQEIIDFFIDTKILCLLGNHDQNVLDLVSGLIEDDELVVKYGNTYKNLRNTIGNKYLSYLKELKSSLELTIDGLKFGVFHGSPENPLNGRVYPDTIIENDLLYNKYDFVILGHTHHKMTKKINDTTILNPGSIGQQRDGKGCSFIVFNTLTCEYTFENVNYNISDLIQDIENYDDGNKKLSEVLFRIR